MDEYKAAFQNLKRYLAKPPLLSPSIQGEDLFLYLAVSQMAISFGPNSWKEQDPTVGLLPKSSFSRGWEEVPKDGEIGTCFTHHFEEASSILSSSGHHRNDGPTHKKVYKQARCSRMHGLMGNRA